MRDNGCNCKCTDCLNEFNFPSGWFQINNASVYCPSCGKKAVYLKKFLIKKYAIFAFTHTDDNNLTIIVLVNDDETPGIRYFDEVVISYDKHNSIPSLPDNELENIEFEFGMSIDSNISDNGCYIQIKDRVSGNNHKIYNLSVDIAMHIYNFLIERDDYYKNINVSKFIKEIANLSMDIEDKRNKLEKNIIDKLPNDLKLQVRMEETGI